MERGVIQVFIVFDANGIRIRSLLLARHVYTVCRKNWKRFQCIHERKPSKTFLRERSACMAWKRSQTFLSVIMFIVRSKNRRHTLFTPCYSVIRMSLKFFLCLQSNIKVKFHWSTVWTCVGKQLNINAWTAYRAAKQKRQRKKRGLYYTDLAHAF